MIKHPDKENLRRKLYFALHFKRDMVHSSGEAMATIRDDMVAGTGVLLITLHPQI